MFLAFSSSWVSNIIYSVSLPSRSRLHFRVLLNWFSHNCLNKSVWNVQTCDSKDNLVLGFVGATLNSSIIKLNLKFQIQKLHYISKPYAVKPIKEEKDGRTYGMRKYGRRRRGKIQRGYNVWRRACITFKAFLLSTNMYSREKRNNVMK